MMAWRPLGRSSSGRYRRCIELLIILEQALDVVELKLRPECFAEATAKLLKNAACALGVDLARHLDGDVVAIVATAQGPPERIGVVVGARLAGAAGLPRPGPLAVALLHLLREVLRPTTKRLQRAALRVDRAVRVALAERAFGIAHGTVGIGEIVAALARLALLPLLTLTLLALLALLAVLTLLVLAETALLHLLKELL